MSKILFKIGDHVSLINETTKGVIININATILTIRSEDGFEYECNLNEITKTGNLDSYLKYAIDNEFVKEDNPSIGNKKIGVKSFRGKKNPPLEVDLHIHELIKSNKGMSNYEMLSLQLSTAKKQLEFAIDKKIQKVVFIHGIGDGVLKNELYFLLNKYPVEIMEASFQKYGQGATEIYIYQSKLPRGKPTRH